jgi:hypothetical protein
MECVGVDVRSAEPITTSALRSLPLAGLIAEHLPSYTTSLTTTDADGTVFTVVHDYRSKPKRGGGHPPVYAPEHWQKVAQVYRDAYAEKKRTPTRAVAREFKVSYSAAAKWVSHCRRVGLLPKTTRGRASVESTLTQSADAVVLKAATRIQSAGPKEKTVAPGARKRRKSTSKKKGKKL